MSASFVPGRLLLVPYLPGGMTLEKLSSLTGISRRRLLLLISRRVRPTVLELGRLSEAVDVDPIHLLNPSPLLPCRADLPSDVVELVEFVDATVVAHQRPKLRPFTSPHSHPSPALCHAELAARVTELPFPVVAWPLRSPVAGVAVPSNCATSPRLDWVWLNSAVVDSPSHPVLDEVAALPSGPLLVPHVVGGFAPALVPLGEAFRYVSSAFPPLLFELLRRLESV